MIRNYIRTLPAGLWATRWYALGVAVGYGWAWLEQQIGR